MRRFLWVICIAVLTLSVIPSFSELVTNPRTGLRTGTITVFADTYTIEPGANLAGANLYNVDLSFVDLRGANLTGASLVQTNFGNANLSGADLAQANLFNANFDNANLNGIRSGGTLDIFSSELPSGWSGMLGGYLIGPNADLSGVDLSGLDLSGVNLSGVNLNQANLSKADLSDANLSETNLMGASLSEVRSGGITGIPNTLPGGWHLIKGYLVGSEAYLRGADLSGADLSGFVLENANLDLANLSGSQLINADLSFASLQNANLSGANLTNADLRQSDLTSSNFSDAILHNSDIRFADLTAADLRNSNLRGSQLARSNLRQADLSDADMTGSNLISANLFDATIDGAILEDVVRNNDPIASLEIAALENQLALVTEERAQVMLELEARPTFAEVQDARAGSIVLVADRENNEVTLIFKVEETEDLKQGTWTTVQGGNISLKVPLEAGNKFMRITLGD